MTHKPLGSCSIELNHSVGVDVGVGKAGTIVTVGVVVDTLAGVFVTVNGLNAGAHDVKTKQRKVATRIFVFISSLVTIRARDFKFPGNPSNP